MGLPVFETNKNRFTELILAMYIHNSGVADGIGVSWYAAKAVYEFYSPFYVNRQMRYELGPVLYLGWLSCLMSKYKYLT